MNSTPTTPRAPCTIVTRACGCVRVASRQQQPVAVALATAVSSPERIAEHTLSWSVAVATPESRDDVGTLGHIFPALVDFHEGVFPQ